MISTGRLYLYILDAVLSGWKDTILPVLSNYIASPLVGFHVQQFREPAKLVVLEGVCYRYSFLFWRSLARGATIQTIVLAVKKKADFCELYICEDSSNCCVLVSGEKDLRLIHSVL